MNARYAVYFAPDPASAWWQSGCAWLGRDALTGRTIEQPRVETLDAATVAQLTAAPRRYGWHATLKPPFRLAAGVDEDVLYARVALLAASLHPVPLGALGVAPLGRFIALVPQRASSALNDLATRCVVELDDLRAPPSRDDYTRRRTQALGAREHELLERYGYPYVLDRFRFHFSLTGALDAADRQHAARLLRAARLHFDALNSGEPPVLDRLCVFVEPEPGAALVRAGDFPLDARA